MKLLLLLTLIHVSHCLGFSAELPNIPEFSKLEDISIDTRSSWHVTLRADGSGKVALGAHGVATLPAGSFSLEELYTSLKPRLVGSSARSDALAIAMRATGQFSVISNYLEDKDWALDFFSKLKTRATPYNPQKFEELWVSNPVLPATH